MNKFSSENIRRTIQNPLFGSSLSCLFFIIIVLVFITPIFETNDDASFMLMLSGKVLSGTPEPQVYFINIVLSTILASLYRLAPDFQWYGYFHLIILFICVWAISFSVLSRRMSVATYSLLGFFLLNVFMVNLLFLQFTRTAYIAGQAGILLAIIIFSESKVQTSKTFPFLVISGFLLLISLTLRIESFALAILLNIPILFFLKIDKKKIRSMLVFSTTFILLATTLWLTHQYHYNQNGWGKFSELNKAKSSFNEDRWSKIDANQNILNKIGWSKNDFYFLWNWGYVNKKIFSKEKIIHFAKLNKTFPGEDTPLSYKFKLFKDSVLKYDQTWWIALTLLPIIIISGRQNWKPVLFFLLLTLITLVAILVWMKLPSRIFYPVFTGVFIMSLISAGTEPFFKNSKLGLTTSSVCLSLLLFLFIIFNTPQKLARQSREIQNINKSFRLNLKALSPKKEQTFIVWGGGFPYELILPLEEKSYLETFKVFSIGVLNQSPFQLKKMKEMGIEDPFLAALNNKNIFLSLKQWTKPLLKKYLYEHYRIITNLQPHFSSNFFTFYEVHSP
ncbi:MAG: hypothetical protein C0623_11995 [Desulfuromonas sp.]|nr:MAG: hypothetical protein C0623_11995 [Desulfuromonas sp.]